MSKYKKYLKTFYFILPVKQNGYPDLTAWTSNEFLARSYADQYRYLQPVILTCQGTSITDPAVKEFQQENLDIVMGTESEIYTIDVTPFFTPYHKLSEGYHHAFLITGDQEEALGEQWSYNQDQIYEMLGVGAINIFHMTQFLLDDKFRKVFSYIFSKYIIRVLLCMVGDINDLDDDSRKKLGLPTLKDEDYICEDKIFNPYYLEMEVLKHTTRILNNGENDE